MSAATSPRFSLPMRRLHWLMAVLIFLAYLLIEQRGLFPRGSAPRAAMIQGHFWAGLSVFVLVWWRLAVRRRDGEPPIVPPPPHWSDLLATVVRWALYAFMIVMPMLGMATAWSTGKQVHIPFTGITLPALLPEDESLGHTLETVHGTIGDVFYWVIGLHIAAALWHHYFKRDNTLKRMF